mgnify:CR=1 FL=1
MTYRPTILFRVNADVSVGLGHVSRCRSLMLALSSKTECRFSVMTDATEVVSRVLLGISYDLYEIGGTASNPRFNAVVVDLPDPGGVKESFREIADLIVCLDDSGVGLDDQDILIRPNLLVASAPEGMPEDCYWAGQPILHPDFAVLSQIPNTEMQLGKKQLFICFGGSDPYRITLRVAPLLKLLRHDVLVYVVIGAAFHHVEELTASVSGDARFIVQQNIPDIARVLRNADLAIISGGTLLYEACASGVPSIVICQNQEQLLESDIAHAAEAAISLGESANVSDENILSAVERLIDNDSLRQKMGDAGRSLVLPDGAAQLASRLLTCLGKRRAT